MTSRNASEDIDPESVLRPTRVQVGDKVRLVSPGSPPNHDDVLHDQREFESWGLEVELGDNVFNKYGYLAGTDGERLSDLNHALRDPSVRAIVATRGGKGSYRIADQLDFAAARNDPKFLVGFSDITILHMSMWKHSRIVGLHGALYVDETTGEIPHLRSQSLRAALMSGGPTIVASRAEESTSQLTTNGTACGPLLGGNLDMIAAGAGWALPDLHGAILFIEAVDLHLGQVDRQLTMLRNAGHLDGIAGIAVGQFTKFSPSKGITIIGLLRDHLSRLGVPILGGLPLGHGDRPATVPLGAVAVLDAEAGTLVVE
ncbi:S66 peptidase family protein [Mycolicibacterium palauense]|uniref:S66 peptidase family protein n=1 Tax=Mycolicibacterium palauense TaxID=2034511 RepID=UPI001C3F319E|nr:LD-carboxypeptidase [Mycolicibacterium palauense]